MFWRKLDDVKPPENMPILVLCGDDIHAILRYTPEREEMGTIDCFSDQFGGNDVPDFDAFPPTHWCPLPTFAVEEPDEEDAPLPHDNTEEKGDNDDDCDGRK